MSQVFSMPRDMTQRNMGTTKEVFLTHEKKSIDKCSAEQL